MKKGLNGFIAIWGIIFALYLFLGLMTPVIYGDDIDFEWQYWFSFGAIAFMYLVNLACGCYIFKSGNRDRTFFNLPAYKYTISGTIAMIVVCFFNFIIVPNMSQFVACFLCLLVVAFTAIPIIKVGTAANIVMAVDQQTKAQTFFIKTLSIDADTLMRSASTPLQPICKNVYEAIRYADPMSADALVGIESQITLKFNEFSNAVYSNNSVAAESLGRDVIILVNNRNQKCKLLK